MTTLTKKLSLPIFILAVLISFPCSGQERTWFPIGASSKTLSYGPLWVALRQGFFEQQGLDVQLITMRGSPLTLQALAGGSIYVAAVTTDTTLGTVDKGLDLVMIGA